MERNRFIAKKRQETELQCEKDHNKKRRIELKKRSTKEGRRYMEGRKEKLREKERNKGEREKITKRTVETDRMIYWRETFSRMAKEKSEKEK